LRFLGIAVLLQAITFPSTAAFSKAQRWAMPVRD
jgi:hypothetical protein